MRQVVTVAFDEGGATLPEDLGLSTLFGGMS